MFKIGRARRASLRVSPSYTAFIKVEAYPGYPGYKDLSASDKLALADKLGASYTKDTDDRINVFRATLAIREKLGIAKYVRGNVVNKASLASLEKSKN